MLTMRIDSMIAALVRQELKGGKNGEALHIHLDLGVSFHTGHGSYDQRRGLHLLYQVDEGYSYINVFSAVLDSPFAKIGDVKKWKHECTHDTCWRDIQLFSQLYFEMCKLVNEEMVKDGLPEQRPCDMSEHNSFPVFGQMFDWVKVKVSKDPKCERNYHKVVEVLK